MVKFKVEDANFNKIYPVGSIYMSINETNPSELFGGEWEQIEDKFLLACGTKYQNGATGGSADSVVVSHNHTQNAHNHTPTTTNNKYLTTNQDIRISGSTRAWASQVSSGGTHYVYVDPSNFSSSASMNEEANTKNTTATNNSIGESGTGKNMPPYLAVYVWVRIA